MPERRDPLVTHVPANALMGEDVKHISLDRKAPPHGQLEIRLDTCKGERIAIAPLGPGQGYRPCVAPRQPIDCP